MTLQLDFTDTPTGLRKALDDTLQRETVERTAGADKDVKRVKRAVTHCSDVLTWLQAGNTINRKQAMVDFGIGNLSARIADLRAGKHDGTYHNIGMDNKTEGYAVYYLESDETQS